MNHHKFKEEGYCVVRKAVSLPTIASWLEEIAPHLPTRIIDPYNPVDYRGHMPDICMPPALVDIAAEIHGPDVGMYYQRLLIKDELSKDDERPWHQDTPYYMGFDQKTSVFVAITPMTATNGCLRLAPGTHRYGSLGDVGSIDINALGVLVTGQITLDPGDVLAMNGLTIHGGVKATSIGPRILGHVVYQPASDPSTDVVVRGTRGTGPRLPPDRLRDQLFHINRVKRLKERQ